MQSLGADLPLSDWADCDLVVSGGTIVTPAESYEADIGVRDGMIVAIGKCLHGEQMIDASGKYVLPGAVDVHTHFELPFMGATSPDDFQWGTIAAACGGTTTIVDFALQSKGGTLREAVEVWQAKAAGKAVIDYGFHVAITDLTEDVLAEIPHLIEEGIPSFKIFMAYKGTLMVDDETFFRTLLQSKTLGALICVHCENGDLIEVLVEKLLAEGKTAPRYHALSRPSKVEDEATGRAIDIAELAKAPLYIVHLSSAGALERVSKARRAGLPVYAETCPQYLLLGDDKYEGPGFEGAKYVMSPALRPKGHQEALWQGLVSGDVQVVASDHAAFNFVGHKDMGRDSFDRIVNGVPGVETRVPLLYSEGVGKKRFSINKFVDLVATTPARLLGLLPRKGTIAVGADADLVIFDPDKEVILSQKNLHSRIDYCLYEGFRVKGYPVVTIARGEVIVKDNEFIGQVGAGRFVRRQPFMLPYFSPMICQPPYEESTSIAPTGGFMNNQLGAAQDKDILATRAFYRERGLGARVGFGKNPALLIVDFIIGFTDPSSPLGAVMDKPVEATAKALRLARRKGLVIIYTTVAYDNGYRDAGYFIKKVPSLKVLLTGSPLTEVDPRLKPEPGEHVAVKKFASAFFGTNVASLLTSEGVDTIILTGTTTSGCIRASAIDGLQLGFRVIVPEECVCDRAQGPHEANLFDIDSKYGDVVSLQKVLDYLQDLPTPGHHK